MGFVMTIVAFLAAGPIAEVMGEPKLTPILQALSPSLAITGLASTAEAILKRDLAFKSLAARTMFGATAGGTVGVIAAFNGLEAWSLVLQLLVQAVVQAIVIWVAVEWRPGLNVSWLRFKELFGFSINVIGMNLLNFLNRQSDDLLIAAVLGTKALGYYSVAYRILLMLTEVMTRTIDAVTLPTFARVQDSIDRLRGAYLMATRFSSTIATPIFLALAALAPLVIPVVFGAKWEQSVPVMQILAFIGTLHAAIFFSGNVLLAIGQPRKALFITAVNAVSNVAAFAVAAHWGITAVAAAYVIRGYILAPLPIWFVKRALHFSWGNYLRVTLVPFGCATIMVLCILALRPVFMPVLGEVGTLLVLGAVAPVIYWTAMRTFADRYVAHASNYLASASPRLSRLLMWTPSIGGSRA
jgi:PST family polysaccharide transporter